MDDQELIEKIKKARQFAKKYFNSEQATNPDMFDKETLALLPPKFFVEFVDIDKMVVRPSFWGKPAELICFCYILAFNPDGSMQWSGFCPQNIRMHIAPIKIPENENKGDKNG